MDTDLKSSTAGQPWQATITSILRDMRDEYGLLANKTNVISHQPVPKELTPGALFMIFVILFFVILTLIRSSVSLYERWKTIRKESNSSAIKRKEKAINGATNADKETSNDGVFLREILDCFCIKSNAKRIFSPVSSEEQLISLHGIRGFIVIWVTIDHTIMFYISAIKSPGELQSTLDASATLILKNTIFIVDTFFVLSGFLIGYFFSQRYKKRNGKISWLSFYAHRFLRLTPMYFLALGFYSMLFPYLGSGPAWPTYNVNPVCREVWIRHVFFINNFNSHMKQCLATSWYIPCELQLYIVSPIFLTLLMRRPKIGYAFVVLGISGSCLIYFIFTMQYNLMDGITRIGDYYSTDMKDFHRRFGEYYDLLHVKPYSRLGTFLIGLTLGCYLFQKKETSIKNSLLKLSLGWIVAAIFMLIALFALYGREECILETAIYNAIKHVLYSCSLGWIIFVCVTGQGGFVNRFLSSKIFIVFSRLSFTIYLTHLIILEGYFLSMEELIPYSLLPGVILHLQLFFTILAAAFVISVIFEAPIYRITSLLMRETNQEVKSEKRE